MQQLHRRVPGVRFLVACYREEQRDRCQRLLGERAPELDASLYVGKTSEIIELGETCLMVSGSVSLEVLARTTPAAVVYHIDRVFYWFCMLLITCRYFSLPNLIANTPVMPEFAPVGNTQPAVAAITDVLHHWLTDAEAYARKIDELTQLRDAVATTGATENAARAILARLDAARKTSRRAA
jgi:lipid-A-disaccharide synthase